MPSEVILPRVDMGMETGKVSQWFVEEGARVQKGQAIFEIETDKAAMEIEAPVSGIIREMVSGEGAEVPVGSVVARIYSENEAYEAPSRPAAVQAAPGAPIDIPTAADAFAEPVSQAPVSPAPVVTTVHSSDAVENNVRATPLARRLARDHEIELGRLRGSGPRGRIQHSDVLAHIALSDKATRTVDTHSSRPIHAGPGPHSAQSQAARLHHVWFREGNGTPLVLIHGFGSDLNSWRPLIPALPSGRSILGIDLPGHGRSPLAGPVTLDHLATSLLETLSAQGINSVHLVGHSLGAAVAASAAARSQLDVRSLMLLSPAGLGPDMNGAFVSGFLRATSEESLAPWARELVFDENALGPSFVSSTMRLRNAETTKSQEQIAASLFPDGTQSFSVRSLLKTFDWPVKIVFGTEDRIIPSRHATGLPGTVAIHLFPATGHMPQLEQRHAIGRLVRELVRFG